MQQRFRALVLELMRQELAAAGVAEDSLDAVARYIGGAFTELLIWSLDRAKPVSPDELERLFQELTRPVLERARRL